MSDLARDYKLRQEALERQQQSIDAAIRDARVADSIASIDPTLIPELKAQYARELEIKRTKPIDLETNHAFRLWLHEWHTRCEAGKKVVA